MGVARQLSWGAVFDPLCPAGGRAARGAGIAEGVSLPIFLPRHSVTSPTGEDGKGIQWAAGMGLPAPAGANSASFVVRGAKALDPGFRRGDESLKAGAGRRRRGG